MPAHVVFVYIAILRTKFFISVLPVSVLYRSGDFLSITAVQNPSLYEEKTTFADMNILCIDINILCKDLTVKNFFLRNSLECLFFIWRCQQHNGQLVPLSCCL